MTQEVTTQLLDDLDVMRKLVVTWRTRAQSAEATLARVHALVEQWRDPAWCDFGASHADFADQLEQALTSLEPTT